MKHKHTLETLAQTRPEQELFVITQTTYNECTGCGKLFETEHMKTAAGKDFKPATRHYAGLLNRNHIMDNAGRYEGRIPAEAEENIYLDIQFDEDEREAIRESLDEEIHRRKTK